MKRLFLGLVAGIFLALAGAGLAQDEAGSADLLRDHLYAGTLAEGEAALASRAETGDAEAQFGVGVLKLVRAIEAFAAAHDRHGFDPINGVGRSPFLPLDIPQGDAPAAEPLDYETLRTIYADFVGALDTARDALVRAGEGEPFVVTFDAASIRLDLNGDGGISKEESVGAFLARTARPLGGFAPGLSAGGIPALRFGFDNADAIWLAGYASVLAAQGDFLLAHDFSRFFDAVFHRFFPRAGLPLADANGNGLILDGESDALLADAIAALHTLNWPVVDRERLAAVPERLRDVLEFSRRNWALILSETDDEAEMLPGPHQTPPEGAPAISAEMVEAWLTTLDAAERVLDGELLIAHWRFPGRGFDLSAFFAEAEHTDLVMLLAGRDALPYLREGEIAGPETFEQAIDVFGADFLGFMLWFN